MWGVTHHLDLEQSGLCNILGVGYRIMMKDYYEIIVASLLHDIGKFKERAFGGQEHGSFPKEVEAVILPLQKGGWYSHRHALWTYDFFENDCKNISLPNDLDWSKIKNLAARHHNPDTNDEKIIDLADNISAASDRSSEVDYKSGMHLKKHLRSVFARISFQNQIPGNHAYELKPIASGNVYPVVIDRHDETVSLESQYKQLWDAFIMDLKKSMDAYRPIHGLNQFVFLLASLLQKYCWCIPSATNDMYCDISLYDHAITTAAIALVLKAYQVETKNTDIGDGEKPFLFFAGDLSGIQDYIFQHQHKAFAGSSKIIRGRSFYISMISNAYCYALCNALGIPPFVQIMNAGGKFTLLLPNVPKVKDSIQDFTAEADEWFFNTFHGDFTVVYTYSVEASKKDMALNSFSNIIKTINYNLTIAKSRKFSNILKHGNCIIDVHYDERELCKSCGRYSPLKGIEEERCELCQQMFTIGSKITKNSIILFHTREGDIDYFNKKISLSITDSVDHVKSMIGAFVFDDANEKLPLMLYNNYVPIKNGATMEFNDIAAKALGYDSNARDQETNQFATGSKFLAYIMLDVDNMGSIFSNGIKDLSVSRYVTLSRMFNIFFNLVIKDMLQNEFPAIYTVFSGGDDLFVIAPWNNVIHFIDAVEKKFKQFTCNHPDVHFSTGVHIQKPDYPMSKCALLVSEKLEKAKNAGRNSIHYFNTMTYDKLQYIHKEAQWLIERNNSKESNINHSFLYRLLRYSRMAKKVYENKFEPSQDLMYIPYFKYDISRNIVIKKMIR